MSTKSEAIFEALFEALSTAPDAEMATLAKAIAEYKATYPASVKRIRKSPMAAGLLDAIDEAIAFNNEMNAPKESTNVL